MSSLEVVVLAAGQGTRMRSRLPKVLHRLAGRSLLEHVLDTVQGLSPAAVHVVFGHGGEQVRQCFPDRDIVWVEQVEQLGTGHAVNQAMPAVTDASVVLVLYGDVPLVDPATLEAVVAPALNGQVGLITMTLDDPTGYGRICRSEDGEVTGIVEQKDASPEQWAITEVNTGILAAPAVQLRQWLAGLRSDNVQGELYLTDVIGMAAADGLCVETVQAANVEEVAGINDRVQLAELERWYQRREAERLMRAGATVVDPARLDVRGPVTVGQDVTFDVNVILEGRVVLGDGVSIGPNCVIKDAQIGAYSVVHANSVIESASAGPGCLIGPFARLRPGAVLAESVHIGNYVEVKNSTLGAGSKANHLTYLGDSQIGRDVNVGAGTITCNYDGANKHRTVIGDRAFIGSGVELIAPVTVNDDATIGAGTTLGADAPAGQLTVARARTRSIRGWKRPIKTPR